MRSSVRKALVLTLVLTLVPALAQAQQAPPSRPMPRGVVVQASIERYPVSGTTVEEITAGLRGALGQEGGFLGHYHVSWRYNYRIGEGVSGKAGCRLANVRVEMQTRVRAPDWKAEPGTPEDVALAWATFTTSFEDHLREHENLAIRTAGDFVQKLERMTDMSCRQLSLDVQREAKSASERLQDRHRKLDADTKNGAMKGARWPPAPPF